MGDEIKLFLGECFVSVDEDQANNYVEKVVEEKQKEMEEKQDRLEKLEKDMKSYKTYLYAKFGSSINLEEQDD